MQLQQLQLVHADDERRTGRDRRAQSAEIEEEIDECIEVHTGVDENEGEASPPREVEEESRLRRHDDRARTVAGGREAVRAVRRLVMEGALSSDFLDARSAVRHVGVGFIDTRTLRLLSSSATFPVPYVTNFAGRLPIHESVESHQ